MKKLILSATFAFTLLATSNTFAQQGFGTNQPDKSAAVEIVSSKRGLLIPRIELTATNTNVLNNGEITAPANSLFIYNTATAGSGSTAVTPGFYYWERTNTALDTAWEGKWVRFVSDNSERDVVVEGATNGNIDVTATDYINGVKTYEVSVKGGATAGQVLVTKVDAGVTTTEWVNPNDFILDVLVGGNAIGISKDTNGDIEVKFNGTLSENTTIATGTHNLAITGLEKVTTAPGFVLVMGEDGILKQISKDSLIDAKNMTSSDGIITLNGLETAEKSLLVDVVLGVADGSIAPSKFKAETTDEGKVPVVKTDGTVEWTTIPGTSAATLSTDGKIVIGNNTSIINSLANAVLTATELSIKKESITSEDIQNGTIQTEDMKAGGNTTVLVTKADGTVSWIEQSDLANKDNYNFTAPLTKDAGVDNSTGGKDFNVNIEGAALTSTSLTVSDATNKALLGALALEITPGTIAGQVLTTTGTGTDLTTSWGTPNSLVLANNGLEKGTADAIQLGGDLIKATTINTGVTDVEHTLGIKGLVNVLPTEANKNKAIVVESTTGILRTVDKVITGTNVDVSTNAGYSFHTPEVVINVTLGNTDESIVFPSAASAEGQVINIKIANKNESHSGYLTVLDTYGSMPFQGWIVKSNGVEWVIVGRN
ncbi:autotransporter outer membrane beta-barrel domain-containing protein [Myroides guanonis]|uniref:Collagen triple helix repeat-containing protein n=1 Tax=Myroides guanonis TaxID=1150112 RepID=A0A1I3L5M9_9FLAO|nr:hypothetical protein [Myroides guanonis]SFI80043.1 hypothetical protein SAMN04487893_101188 [Myroides guanonis]